MSKTSMPVDNVSGLGSALRRKGSVLVAAATTSRGDSKGKQRRGAHVSGKGLKQKRRKLASEGNPSLPGGDIAVAMR
jgi:hypothetical protein